MIKYNFINLLIIYHPLILNLLIIIILILPNKFNKLNPLNLIIILIFNTLLICIKINSIFKSWIYFILFLILIGGLIIIFIYIIRIANNEINILFKIKNYIIIINKISIILILFIIIIQILTIKFNLTSQDLWNLNIYLFEEKNELNFIKLYNYNIYIILFLIIYLFYSIITIINICYKFNLPLRQISNYE